MVSWIKYGYYLRFSLFFWLFPIGFALLDSGFLPLSTAALSRGIWVAEDPSAILCTVFFLFSLGFSSLVTMRVVILNGQERYGDAPPRWLYRMFSGESFYCELISVIVILLPTCFATVYLAVICSSEGVAAGRICAGVFLGIGAATLFWCLLNVSYYLLYRRPGGGNDQDAVCLGVNAARTLLFPRMFFGLAKQGSPLREADRTIEGFVVRLLPSTITNLANWLSRSHARGILREGYFYKKEETCLLYEGHRFSIIAYLGFTALYLLLWPMIAPVPTIWANVSLAAIVLITIAALVALMSVQKKDKREGTPTLWIISSSFLVVLFCFMIFWLYFAAYPARFPVLATILLIILFLDWLLCGISFCLDAYRIPAVSVIWLIVFVQIMLMHHPSEEHYFSGNISGAAGDDSEAGVTPRNILEKYLQKPLDGKPLVVITSTGGGIHASAWTTNILFQLEDQLKKSGVRVEEFRGHILLVSAVSGGSVGALYYLRDIKDQVYDGDRMRIAGVCSSLESIGWGLLYTDLPKAISILWGVIPSNGADDLGASPIWKDRTWSLRRSFDRNVNDSYCRKHSYLSLQPESSFWNRVRGRLGEPVSASVNMQDVTLRRMTPRIGSMPAFTMNSTTVDTGERYVLGNYRLPKTKPAESAIAGRPASSLFDIPCGKNILDMPAVTAAQLSATFPLVSSATRAPMPCGLQAHHFVDGGYYDNDGTASALEFLRYAIDGDSPKAVPLNSERKESLPLRVLLIEIRNSLDPESAEEYPEKYCNKSSSDYVTGMIGQIGAPLEAFWGAGHTGVTMRNRSALDQFLKAHKGSIELHQIIFDDNANSPVADANGSKVIDPLSWSLTPRQRGEVESSSSPEGALKERYQNAVDWFRSYDRKLEEEKKKSKHPDKVN